MLIVNLNKSKNYTIGGKAQGLLKLISLGFAVPKFIVIPAEVIKIKSIHELENFNLNASDLNTLEEKLNLWEYKAKGVSVRSSLADEDGTHHAFSGIMETYLNLRSLDDVLLAIRNCIAGAYSEKAMQYRLHHQLKTEPKIALIIQQQIHSEVSGILFTTNPLYPQELAIHTVYGQGQGIVSGKYVPDEYYVLKHNAKLYRKKIVEKTEELSLSSTGLYEAPIQEDKQNIESLSSTHIQELWKAAQLLEESLAIPQDVEFAIESGKMWYLQSRAITQKIEDLIVFDNSNIQESYSGVLSPLSFSFAQRAYATVYTQTMRSLNLPESVIQDHKIVVENLLGMYKGRVYYNINNWYKGLLLLPSFKQNKSDMERMMGLKEPVNFIVNTKKSLIDRLKLLPQLSINIVKLSIAFVQLNRRINAFLTYFTNYHFNFYKHIDSIDSKHTIWQEKLALDKYLLDNWSTPIINDFYVMMLNGRVHRKLLANNVNNPDQYLSQFKYGQEGIASFRQGKELDKLASVIHTKSILTSKILNKDISIHEYIRTNEPLIFEDIQRFIHEYGDRTIAELKLETISMRNDVQVFYKYLSVYLNDDIQKFDQNHDKNERIPFYVKKLLGAIKNREELRLKRTHLFGMYRTLYLKIGDYLFKDSKIKSARDIFFLTESEIEQCLFQNANYLDLIETRKIEFEEHKLLEVPDRVFFPEPIELSVSEEFTKEGILRGEPCAGNKVIGEAIVVESVDDNLDLKGKIIIAKRTDPGWIALFPSCLGVVIERGSSLSHSVILLREMNKPSIINVPNLLRHIKTGDIIELDPQNAEIKIRQ